MVLCSSMHCSNSEDIFFGFNAFSELSISNTLLENVVQSW